MKNMYGVSEKDIVEMARTIILEKGRMRISQLIMEIERRFPPTGQDAEILENRSDTYFSQKIRNLVSHRDPATDIIHGVLKYSTINDERDGFVEIV